MPSNLTRFDPMIPAARFDPLGGIENFFNAFGLPMPMRPFDMENRIRMDVTETDQAYLVKAEMPGVNKEDIKVSIDGDEVTIRAEVSNEQERTEGNVVCLERHHGQQFRNFTLPQDVDGDQATAVCHDGILELTLPKKPGGGAKQIAIQ